MSLETVVVGVDDSPGSCAAVEWAVELASLTGSTVLAVHAFEPLDHLDQVGPGTDFAAVREDITQRATHEWCGRLAETGSPFEVVVKEGRPADVLISVARERNADLIVVGARRMGWLRTLTLGSTSHRVLYEAQRPVTVIHPPEA